MPLIDPYQGGVLVDRTLETLLADIKRTSALLLLAPALAGAVVLADQFVAWTNASLCFVMALSCVAIGGLTASGELARERALFLRERMAGLHLGAYLYAKLRVLALVGVVQTITYALIVSATLHVPIAIGWFILALLATTVSGICMGLLISSLAGRPSHAALATIAALLPQLVTSALARPAGLIGGALAALDHVMPAHWAHAALLEFSDVPIDLFAAIAQLLAVLGLGALLVLASAAVLARQRY